MKKQRKALAILLALFIAFSLCSCATSSETPSSGSTDTGNSATDPSSSDSSETGGEELTGEIKAIRCTDHTWEPLIEKVESENPGLTVTLETVPLDSIDSKINMAHASGQAYDFVDVNNSSVQQFCAAGLLEPLDSYLEAEGIVLEENIGEACFRSARAMAANMQSRILRTAGC